MDNKNNEIWRPCVGYDGLYEVSNLGRIKSLERTCKGRWGNQHIRERILKPQLRGRKGEEYLIVNLKKNGVGKTWGVHQLVALAFPEICGLPFEGAQCNHIDENKKNNVPENLNWMTPAQNSNHGTRNERMAKALTNRSDLSKTVYQYTKSLELVGEYSSAMEAQRQTGWSQSNISACARGERKTAYNYVWSYTRL